MQLRAVHNRALRRRFTPNHLLPSRGLRGVADGLEGALRDRLPSPPRIRRRHQMDAVHDARTTLPNGRSSTRWRSASPAFARG